MSDGATLTPGLTTRPPVPADDPAAPGPVRTAEAAPAPVSDPDRVETGVRPDRADGPNPTQPGLVDPEAAPPRSGNDGDWLNGLSGVFAQVGEIFAEVGEIVAHPAAQAGMALAPTLALASGLPGLGQAISGIGAIFSLTRAAGLLFGPVPEGQDASFGARLGRALPDLAQGVLYAVNMFLPGAVLGSALAGTLGFSRGLDRLAAERRQQRTGAPEAEPASPRSGAPAAAQAGAVSPALSDAMSQLPEELEDAFTQAEAAARVAAALAALEEALASAAENSEQRQALEREQGALLAALRDTARTVAAARLEGEIELDAAALEVVAPYLPDEERTALTASISAAPA